MILSTLSHPSAAGPEEIFMYSHGNVKWDNPNFQEEMDLP